MQKLILSILAFSLCYSTITRAQAPHLVIPTGHAAPITALALSGQGDYIFTGSQDGNAILWNKEGDQLTSFNDLSILKKQGLFSNVDGNQAAILGISSLAILPNGQLLTGSQSGKLIFWKPDGTPEKEVSEHASAVNIIKIAPDGEHFAAGDASGALIYWSIDGAMEWKIKRAHHHLTALTFSADGKKLFSGGMDREIEVWDIQDGSKIRSFSKTRGQGTIMDLAISPDGQYLIAGNLPRLYVIGSPMPDRVAFIYDMEGKVLRKLDQHTGSPLAVAFTAKSGVPVIGTSNGEVIAYPKGKPPIFLKVHEALVTRMASIKGSDELLSAGGDGKAFRLDPVKAKLLISYDGLIDQFAELGIHREKMELLWSDAAGKAGTFDLTGRNIQALENLLDPLILAKMTGQYAGVSVLQDFALKYDGFGNIQRINLRNGAVLNQDPIREHNQETLRVISFDGKKGFASSNFPDDDEKTSLGALEAILDMDNGRRRLVCGVLFDYQNQVTIPIVGHAKMVIAAAFSSDHQKLLTGSQDKTVMLWDAQMNPTVLNGHDEGISAVAFSPDDQTIITAGDDQRLIIRAADGRIIHTLNDLGFIPKQLLFSPDGQYLFASGQKSVVRIIELAQGKMLGRLFLFGNQDWAFLGEDGLFDASPNAMSKMYYTIYADDHWEKLELSQLKARFFEPNIITKQLGLSQERPRSTDGLTEVPLFPQIEASIAKDVLKVNLTERSGGIGPVTLSINGKEVLANANPGGTAVFQVDLKPFQKYLYRDKTLTNLIRLRAYNKSAWLKSSPFTLEYQPNVLNVSAPVNPNQPSTQPLDAGAPKMYVLSIGTSDYSGDQLDLKYADLDAKAMAMALKSVGSQLFSAPEQVEVYCLNTTAATEAELSAKNIDWAFAEKEKIAQLFTELAQKSRSNDIIVVYLSGHGISYGSAEKTQFYYLTQGIATDDLSDEGVREKYAISSDEFTSWLSAIPALKQVLVIDACNSGTIVEKLTGGTKNLSSGQILALDRMKDRTGMFILSGSAADKVSYEASEFGQGLLTYSLLQGMNGMAIRKTAQASFIDVMNLFQYARDEVPQLAASIDGIQTPMLGFPDQGASFDIGIYNEGVEIPLASKKPTFIRSNFQNELTFDDDLGLGNLIDGQLQLEAGKGPQANLVFVDLNKREGAYSIKGRYTKENGQIKLNVRLFSPDGSSEILDIKPSDSPEAIAKIVVRTVKKLL